MNIKRCEFTDYGTLNYSYGFRAYDDNGQTYSNLMEKVELKEDDESFLRLIIAQYADDTFTDMFDWALHNSGFIVIDDVEYNIETTNGWKLIEKE